MNCLKCGRETENDQVFCQHCLDSMDAYPIKPGTAVQLPNRSAVPASKKSARRKRIVQPEELLTKQKALIRRLKATCVILCLVLAVCSFFLVKNLLDADMRRWIGKNYSIQTESTADTSEPVTDETSTVDAP